jgi:hypothetical protein
MGIATRFPESVAVERKFALQSITLAKRAEQNLYTAELSAIANGLLFLPQWLTGQVIAIFTNNLGAALSLRQPRQQSGQEEIASIYESSKSLRQRENKIMVFWRSIANDDSGLASIAKEAAKRSTVPERLPWRVSFRAKSTTFNNAKKTQPGSKRQPESIGKYSKWIDRALPGPHTCLLYDPLTNQEACILAQLRTGMIRLNSYLFRIGAETSADCTCGRAQETVKHFLFRCTRWTAFRDEMLQCTNARKKQPVILLRRQGDNGSRQMVTRLDCCTSDDQVRYQDRTTATCVEHITLYIRYSTITNLHGADPTNYASAADHRTLNTKKSQLQVDLPPTPHNSVEMSWQ